MSEFSSITSGAQLNTASLFEEKPLGQKSDAVRQQVDLLAQEVNQLEQLTPETLTSEVIDLARQTLLSLEREVQNTVHFSGGMAMQQFMLDSSQFDGMHNRLDALDAVRQTLFDKPPSTPSSTTQSASARWALV